MVLIMLVALTISPYDFFYAATFDFPASPAVSAWSAAVKPVSDAVIFFFLLDLLKSSVNLFKELSRPLMSFVSKFFWTIHVLLLVTCLVISFGLLS